jgi:hypothetical protein
MLKWDSRNPPYRVRIPEYLEVPAAYGRVGLVVGECRGVGGLGPLVAVLLDGAASSTVAALKADCTVLEGSKENEVHCGRLMKARDTAGAHNRETPSSTWH